MAERPENHAKDCARMCPCCQRMEDYAAALLASQAATVQALARAEERESRWMLAVTHGPCKCDPPGSGEELCSGGCYLREERDALARELAAARERWLALTQYLHHFPGCDSIGSLPGDCPCGLRFKMNAALAPPLGAQAAEDGEG